MAAMDRCVEFLKNEGKERFEAFAARLEDFYAFIRGLERIRIPGYEIRGDYGIFDFDRSKILLVPDAHGGEWLAEELRKKDHLELEMAAGGYGLALTSVMDTEEGFERLRKALNRIDGELADEEAACVGKVGAGVEVPWIGGAEVSVMTESSTTRLWSLFGGPMMGKKRLCL